MAGGDHHRASSLPPLHSAANADDAASETRSTPSPRRRQTKCVPLLKLMEQQRRQSLTGSKEQEAEVENTGRGLLKVEGKRAD